jgi:hypothetical protein
MRISQELCALLQLVVRVPIRMCGRGCKCLRVWLLGAERVQRRVVCLRGGSSSGACVCVLLLSHADFILLDRQKDAKRLRTLPADFAFHCRGHCMLILILWYCFFLSSSLRATSRMRADSCKYPRSRVIPRRRRCAPLRPMAWCRGRSICMLIPAFVCFQTLTV